MNIPYNQAFLEEGGLAPSTAANTLNSLKGRIIMVVVGSRANYPAKVLSKVYRRTVQARLRTETDNLESKRLGSS